MRSVRNVLVFACLVEAGTALAVFVNPSFVTTLLMGSEVTGAGTVVARCFGIAIFSLALACWPGRRSPEPGDLPFRGMLAYNAAIALFLAQLGIRGRVLGPLLWPAVAVHLGVALLLVWTGRGQRSTEG